MVEFLAALALALMLWYGGLRSLEGTLTVGTLAAFIQLSRRFFQPLQDLSEKVNLLQGAMASSERIFQLLDEPVAVAEPAVPAALASPVRGEVGFEGVWFRYSPTGPWVLRDVSFTAAPGRTLALVGHTGAGKTTVISLLLRFYEPERGRITIDGVDIQDLPTATLRGLIGFVQQDLFLFAGDIVHNLVLDAPVPEARAREAAERVGADRFIARLPSGYRHRLGERGRSLSVGERQLLSFARALALDPAILLLDEATSSVEAAHGMMNYYVVSDGTAKPYRVHMRNADFANLQTAIDSVPSSDAIHVDVMDNHFVPNLTLGLPVVESIRKITDKILDIHLMIEDPDRWAPGYAEAGAESVTFHIEAAQAPVRLARELRRLGARAAMALKPATPIEPYQELLPELDMVLIMTVEPGFGGQSFLDLCLPKITRTRAMLDKLGGDIWLQIDGGVSAQTIERCAAAGVDSFVAGSSVFGADDPDAMVTKLRELAAAAA